MIQWRFEVVLGGNSVRCSRARVQPAQHHTNGGSEHRHFVSLVLASARVTSEYKSLVTWVRDGEGA